MTEFPDARSHTWLSLSANSATAAPMANASNWLDVRLYAPFDRKSGLSLMVRSHTTVSARITGPAAISAKN